MANKGRFPLQTGHSRALRSGSSLLYKSVIPNDVNDAEKVVWGEWFFGGAVIHGASGVLNGVGSEVVGASERVIGTVNHSTSGALVGQGASVAGSDRKSVV
jgi:hypothetical protein